MFYKNGLVLGSYFKDKEGTVRSKYRGEELDKKFLIDPDKDVSRYYKGPFSSYYYYFRSLFSIAYGYFDFVVDPKDKSRWRFGGG